MSVPERSDVRTFRRLERLPRSQALALAAVFVALGVALSTFAIPVGPARVFPFQATINVIAGVLLGPWYALLTAFAISVLRNAAGTGTFLAFPGLGLRRAAGRLRLPLVA
jgi:energy coupling factor transporter S component ThiW